MSGSNYADHLNKTSSGSPAGHTGQSGVPQTEKRDPKQRQNWGGGYSYEVDCWTQLNRFLILGSEDGNYYAGARELTLDNVGSLEECLDEDPDRAVDQIREISVQRRGLSNNTCIFALAYCLQYDTPNVKEQAQQYVLDVCRTGSHILRLVDELDSLGGWPKTVRDAVASWYELKPVSELAYQCVKYQNRHGWSHQDAMRMAHPDFDRSEEPTRDALFEWVCDRWDEVPEEVKQHDDLERVRLKERINATNSSSEAASLIKQGALPREFVPGRLKGSKDVWRELLFAGNGMPVWSLTRNLGKMSEVGLFDDQDALDKAVDLLTDEDVIEGSGIHPVKLLTSRLVYESGRSFRGSLRWPVKQELVKALEDGFYTAFSNVEPTGDRFLLALDVSGSMTGQITGHNITAMQSAAACAMTRVRSEAKGDGSTKAIAFSDGSNSGGWGGRKNDYTPTSFPLSATDQFDEIYNRMDRLDFAATNCALPMKYAEKKSLDVDTFVVYTDSETNTRDQHPQDALNSYRQSTGKDAKMVVVGLQANPFSIAHPDDPLTMDVAGWDAQLPEIINRHVNQDFDF